MPWLLALLALLVFAAPRGGGSSSRPGLPRPKPGTDPNAPRSAHFSLEEFASPDGALPPPSTWANVQRLMFALETLRAYLGGAAVKLTRAGGYRTPGVNAASPGRAPESQHMDGEAADVQVTGYTPGQVYSAIDFLQRSGKIEPGGAHAYADFTHLDVRGTLARWQ